MFPRILLFDLLRRIYDRVTKIREYMKTREIFFTRFLAPYIDNCIVNMRYDYKLFIHTQKKRTFLF